MHLESLFVAKYSPLFHAPTSRDPRRVPWVLRVSPGSQGPLTPGRVKTSHTHGPRPRSPAHRPPQARGVRRATGPCRTTGPRPRITHSSTAVATPPGTWLAQGRGRKGDRAPVVEPPEVEPTEGGSAGGTGLGRRGARVLEPRRHLAAGAVGRQATQAGAGVATDRGGGCTRAGAGADRPGTLVETGVRRGWPGWSRGAVSYRRSRASTGPSRPSGGSTGSRTSQTTRPPPPRLLVPVRVLPRGFETPHDLRSGVHWLTTGGVGTVPRDWVPLAARCLRALESFMLKLLFHDVPSVPTPRPVPVPRSLPA